MMSWRLLVNTLQALENVSSALETVQRSGSEVHGNVVGASASKRGRRRRWRSHTRDGLC